MVSNELFGALEVDIEVPEDLYDYFEEMCPLFVTTEVKFEDIGEHMQEHIKHHNMSHKEKTLLIGGLKAKKVLISMPLLKWYLEKGLKVTCIYQVLEFEPKDCFKDFVEEITQARRLGDRDPTQKVIGETMKLLGNSSYGSMIMDKEKHMSISYTNDKKRIQQKINEPNFFHLEDLDHDMVEIESKKKIVRLNTPVQIGYFILQYAKLKM